VDESLMLINQVNEFFFFGCGQDLNALIDWSKISKDNYSEKTTNCFGSKRGALFSVT
jgi:hypothetical protein